MSLVSQALDIEEWVKYLVEEKMVAETSESLVLYGREERDQQNNLKYLNLKGHLIILWQNGYY